MLLNPALFFMFIIFSQTLHNKENLAGKNKSAILRNLDEETFGTATLTFDSEGSKVLLNVNDIPKEKLSFFLKSGDVLTPIDNALTEDSSISSDFEDSEGILYKKS